MSAICFLLATILAVIAALGAVHPTHALEWAVAFVAAGLLLGAVPRDWRR